MNVLIGGKTVSKRHGLPPTHNPLSSQHSEGKYSKNLIASDLEEHEYVLQRNPQHLISCKICPSQLKLTTCWPDGAIHRVTNCKVIPGESLTTQYHLLVMDFNVTPKNKVAENRKIGETDQVVVAEYTNAVWISCW